MFGGSLLKKSLAGTAWCKGSEVHYYLLTEYLENELEVYGVSVEYLGETTVVSGITLSQRSVISLLNLLRQGTVTPTTARDVIEDWLLD